MGAVTVPASATTPGINTVDVKLMGGPHNSKAPAAKTVVLQVTLPASYDAGGSTLDLSGYFKNRVYWCVPMSASAKNATTGYIQIGVVPGTQKTDGFGGYATTDWKIQCTAGATQSTGDLSAYVTFLVANGC